MAETTCQVLSKANRNRFKLNSLNSLSREIKLEQCSYCSYFVLVKIHELQFYVRLIVRRKDLTREFYIIMN